MSDRSRDWSEQAQRLYDYARARPGRDLSAPELNAAAAGDGSYVVSFTKRVSEVRKRAEREGCSFVKSRDEWTDGQRRTWYRWTGQVFAGETTDQGQTADRATWGAFAAASAKALGRDLARCNPLPAALPAPDGENAPTGVQGAANGCSRAGLQVEMAL